MLKFVYTDDEKDILEEQMIMDDNNKIHPIGWLLIAEEILADIAIVAIIIKFVKWIKSK